MNRLNCIKFLKLHKSRLTVVGICIYASYLRLMSLRGRNLWADEHYQLSQMRGTLFEMIKGFPKTEFATYLSGDYYLIYPFFKIFGYNKWGLAIPHIISTLFGFLILYLICRRYFASVWSYLVTFSIVCFNNTMIFHATEIRTYAVLPTLAMASLYFWLKIIDCYGRVCIRQRVALSLFFIITIWFHAFGVLIFSFTGIYAVLTKYKDNKFWDILRNVGFLVFPILFIAAPLWLLSVFGPRNMDYEKVDFINTFAFIPNPLVDTLGFLKGVLGNLIGSRALYPTLLGPIAFLVLPGKQRIHQTSFLLILVLFPLAVIFALSVSTHYWFIQRLFIWVIPFFALFVGWTWDSLIINCTERKLLEWRTLWWQ